LVFKRLLIDYFEHWFDREPVAAGWREELQLMAIDKREPKDWVGTG